MTAAPAPASEPAPAPDIAPVSARRPRWVRWARTPDGMAVLLLVVVPLAMFAVPALLGHPAIAGDNNIQNFPLRALAGRIIRQGHLPLWNPYIWSGNPLLGGLNAGALYPTTLLFAVLQPVTAWVVNLLVVYWAAGIGTYVLLRQYRLAPLAALFGAGTYTYTGAMMGQLVHLPIVQGMAWLPWLVLAQLRLAWAVLGTGPVEEPATGLATGPTTGPAAVPAAVPAADGTARPRQSPWPWVVLLAVVGGLVLLTGEPRGMADAEIVSIVVFGWLVLRPYHGAVRLAARIRYVALTAAAAVWAAALGAVQLLPGLHFISVSQRAAESYSFFGSGSLPLRWSVLMLVPDLFGGNGLVNQPTYFNSYNLPEVTGYVGLLPLAAGFALLTVSFGRRRARRSSDWGLWVLLAVLGVLLAFGEYTFLGGAFGHIPFFDRLRLQSRNIGIAGLGLAGLLAFWADRLLRDDTPPETTGWRRWVAAAPGLAAIATCLTVVVVPYRFEIAMGSTAVGATLGAPLRPWIVAQLVVAMAVVALVLGARRLRPSMRRNALCLVLVCDALLFLASTATGLSSGNVVVQPVAQPAKTVLGTTGRFAIYDTTAQNIDDLSYIGQPDLNVFTRLPSVQGYGSIVDNVYGAATGTHDLDTLDPCAMQRGAFTSLRLASLLTLPQFLAPMVQPGSPPPAPTSAPSCPGAPAPGTSSRRTFYFGRVLTIGSASLVATGGPAASAASGGSGGSGVSGAVAGGAPGPRVGLLEPSGAVSWPRQVAQARPGGWSVSLRAPGPAVGLVVSGPARSVSDQSTVHALLGHDYRLDGVMQDALGQTGWRFSGLWRQYASFAHPVRPSPVWVANPAHGGTVTMVHATDWGTDTAQVHAPRALTVVRSETYQTGWHVQAQSSTGTRLELPVHRYGLVQSVDVPAGTWRLTFLYRAQGLNPGLIATSAGVFLLVASAALGLRARRRRRQWASRPAR